MKPIRNIRIPGRGAGRAVPSGYLVGRVSMKTGPLELIDQTALGRLGVASKLATDAQAALCGFRFFVGGRPAAGEKIGQGVWTHAVHFEAGQSYSVTSLTPAASTAVWTIQKLVGGVYTIMGTITFAAGSTTGVLVWTVHNLLAGQALALIAPLAQDGTLADISGTVYGSAV